MTNAINVGYSIGPNGDKLFSVLATFPRIILAEVNTHRMLSKNTASSRAIPFNKMVQSVEENPFIPIAWQKEHSGMQGTEYHDEITSDKLKLQWLAARDEAIECAKSITALNGTKQLANRLLEPFMWTTMLITGSVKDGGWDNFFNLRCPNYEIEDITNNEIKYYKSKKDCIGNYEDIDNVSQLAWLKLNKGAAEIHMMQLAECIWDCLNESVADQLYEGEWHIPFNNKLNGSAIDDTISRRDEIFTDGEYNKLFLDIKIKCSVAMAAQTSYTVIGDLTISDFKVGKIFEHKENFLDGTVKTLEEYNNAKWVDGIVNSDKDLAFIERALNGNNSKLYGPVIRTKINYKNLIALHDRLIAQNPPHSSPMEHVAKVMTSQEYHDNVKGDISINGEIDGWCRNFRGFIPYRHIVENNS